MFLKNFLKKSDNLNKDYLYRLSLVESEENEILLKEFPKNKIITSRYTIFTFIPVSFIEQFRKISNFWFLFIMVFYFFSPTTLNVLSIILPVVVVFAISMLKDAYDDIKRHRRDRALNEKKFQRIDVQREGAVKILETKAKNIHVGCIIRVNCDQEFPADLIPIYTTNKNSSASVITANLDGETNIKKINVVDTPLQILGKSFSDNFIVPREYLNLVMQMEYNPPEKDLSHFHGSIKDSTGTKVTLSSENLLLRGCRLVKTDWILGLCAYSGKHTKLSLNLKTPTRKYSVTERQINANILILILLLIIITIIIKAIESNNYLPYFKDIPYFGGLTLTNFSYVQRYLVSVILYAFLIPISIIISYELAQIWTVFLIANDIHLYDPKENIQSLANSSSLADQLGQIEFLFSDKTGTITQNLMIFRAFGLVHREESYFFRKMSLLPVNIHGEDINLEVLDDYLKSQPIQATVESLRTDNEIKFLFTCMALCNTVEASRKMTSDGNYILNYQSASPDEEALIKAAHDIGIVYHGTKDQVEDFLVNKTTPSMETNNNTEDRKDMAFESIRTRYVTVSPELFPQKNEVVKNVLDKNCYIIDEIIEFNSDRKKMSIIVRFPNDTKFVISKGADTSMTEPRACSGSTDIEKSSILTKVTDFSLLGLRTLVYSVKEIKTNEEYNQLIDEIRSARAHIGEDREEKLARAYEKAENGMVLLGVSGVEDKLQEGVKESLESLREAGIQIWVLTGDKEETAISVSQAAGHIPVKSSLMKITKCQSVSETLRMIESHLEGLKIRIETSKNFKNTLLNIPLKIRKAYKQSKSELFSFSAQNNRRDPRDRIRRKHKRFAGAAGEAVALVIDGMSLKFALLPMVQEKFLKLCMNSSTVLCCRVSPLQKALVVEMVSKGIGKLTHSRKNPITAAIGDGGNDVSMILQADIGIGIFGKEGLHAARSADYAIPNFSMLRRLLFVHGSWTYQRISYMMLFFYFKCVFFITPDMIYESYNGYSDQTIFNPTYYSLFNLTFTSIPILVFAFFDRYLPAKSLLRFPRLYRCLTRNPNLQLKNILLWMLTGVVYGIISYYTAYLVFFGIDSSSIIFLPLADTQRVHKDMDQASFGVAVFVYVWLSVMARNFTMYHGLNSIILFIMFLNYAVNTLIIFAIDLNDGVGRYAGVNTVLSSSPAFWFGLILSQAMTVIFDLFWRLFLDFYWKTEVKYAESLANLNEERNRRASENFRNSIRRKSKTPAPRKASVISIYAKEAMSN